LKAFASAFTGYLLAVFAPQAFAEESAIPHHPALTDRFVIGVGAFIPKTSTSAQLNSTTLGAGTVIDFEQALGMETQKAVPDISVRYRISERWRLEAEYFELNRTGKRALDREIQWGDQVFPVNTQVNSVFDIADTRVSVGYSFFKTADKEVGASLGFHVVQYEASLTAAATGTQDGDVLAPLPVASLYGQFALTDRWALGARLDRFSLSYDQYSGDISSMAVDLLYQPFRHLGFGLSYRSLFIDFKSETSKWTGKVDQSFQGPLLSVYGSF